ncbi:hypothetical protein SAMN02745146_2517 [Hymenobacter daecheongensis DSM 21074]|uniref:SPOR domain-containing protein n=1 Tax=Hymenobacter daecheongensis DSM 21074 TaxID=1121955 RepID=A0A1M6HI38_9BACT|nr:hypothetical protein [Hymenobacter daecheongensis]SHJ21861.1 hypothetical protein SAMN02745146_2517 [Hymenobacter daecheongensis DSM 21074]
MQLSDHIRTLLRDHDCVIIPDFGGLIADYAPAQIHPVRHTLAPPTKRVAFNQSLTRNDGLLVDALSQALTITPTQARQLVRDAVLRLQAELETGQRTELPGIGTFRRLAGRGLDFEYTGHQNLLAASYGLPELVSRPIRATDALQARERQPAAPLLTVSRSRRLTRAFKAAAAMLIAGLVLTANYQGALKLGYLPESFRIDLNQATAAPVNEAMAERPTFARQQATLANNSWAEAAPATATVIDNEAEATKTVAEAAAAPAKAPAPAAARKATVAVKPVTVAGKPVALKPAATTATAAPSVAPVAKAGVVAPNLVPAAGPTTIKSRTGRSYIIVGAYTTLAHAEKGRLALLKHGHKNAKVVLPARGSRQFRLSVLDYPSNAVAQQQLPLVRKHLGSDLWVLNY